MTPRRLGRKSVDTIIYKFLDHIAEYWPTYRNNLPQLRRTMMFYNEFAYGIRYLPENQTDNGIEFNPKYPLLDELEMHFSTQATPRTDRVEYTDEIGNLVYDAWPLRREFKGWNGYEEPIEDTVEALMARSPDYFKTYEQTHEFMYEVIGTGYGDFKGERRYLGPSGIPHIWYRGFTTVEEFPEQKKFLDTVRMHPRYIEGVRLMNEAYERERVRREDKERKFSELKAELDLMHAEKRSFSPEGVKIVSDYLETLK